jgi:capsular polysaccharide biosynthesis protein
MSKVQVELAELRQQIAESEGLVGSLKTRVNAIPETEAEMTRLNRDYQVNKAQHQALLQRLESARLSEQAEASTEQVRFRVIESPTVPLLPIGPRRGLFMTAVLFIALGAGIALAFVMDQLKPVFQSRGMLGQVTGLPVLGAIRFVSPVKALPLFRRDPVLVGIAGGALLFTYLVSVVGAERASRLIQSIVG